MLSDILDTHNELGEEQADKFARSCRAGIGLRTSIVPVVDGKIVLRLDHSPLSNDSRNCRVYVLPTTRFKAEKSSIPWAEIRCGVFPPLRSLKKDPGLELELPPANWRDRSHNSRGSPLQRHPGSVRRRRPGRLIGIGNSFHQNIRDKTSVGQTWSLRRTWFVKLDRVTRVGQIAKIGSKYHGSAGHPVASLEGTESIPPLIGSKSTTTNTPPAGKSGFEGK